MTQRGGTTRYFRNNGIFFIGANITNSHLIQNYERKRSILMGGESHSSSPSYHLTLMTLHFNADQQDLCECFTPSQLHAINPFLLGVIKHFLLESFQGLQLIPMPQNSLYQVQGEDNLFVVEQYSILRSNPFHHQMGTILGDVLTTFLQHECYLPITDPIVRSDPTTGQIFKTYSLHGSDQLINPLYGGYWSPHVSLVNNLDLSNSTVSHLRNVVYDPTQLTQETQRMLRDMPSYGITPLVDCRNIMVKCNHNRQPYKAKIDLRIPS